MKKVTKQQFIDEYEKGTTLKEMGKKYGVHLLTIHRYAKKIGLKREKGNKCSFDW